MSRRRNALLLAVSLLLPFDTSAPADAQTPPAEAPAGAPAAATPTTGQVKGRVFWSDTGQAISKASVSLRREGAAEKEESLRTQTGGDGHYVFDEVRPDTYALSLSWLLPGALPCSSFEVSGPRGTVGGGPGFGMTATTNRGEKLFIFLLPAKHAIAAGDILQADLTFRCR